MKCSNKPAFKWGETPLRCFNRERKVTERFPQANFNFPMSVWLLPLLRRLRLFPDGKIRPESKLLSANRNTGELKTNICRLEIPK